MEDSDGLIRVRRIEENLLRLENLDPFSMPPQDMLRKFIDELLRDMVADAINLRKERRFNEAACILHKSLLVYVHHIYPRQLQKPEDDARVLDLRIFKATMSVYAGVYHWAIDEMTYVVHHMQVPEALAERRRDAQVILSVAKAGLAFVMYIHGKQTKIELMRQQKTLHRLNGTSQEELIKFVMNQLDAELGPFVEAAEVSAAQDPTPDPEWIPDFVKKHKEKVEANKAKKQEKKKKSRSRPSRNRTDSSARESPDAETIGSAPTAAGDAGVDTSSETSTFQPSASGDNMLSMTDSNNGKGKSQPVTPKKTAAVEIPRKTSKVGLDQFPEASPKRPVTPTTAGGGRAESGRRTPTPQRKGSESNPPQRPKVNQRYGLDTFEGHHEEPLQHRAVRTTPAQSAPAKRPPSPQSPGPTRRSAPSPLPQVVLAPPPRLEMVQPSFEALSPTTQNWLTIFQFKLACPRCFPMNPHCVGVYAFSHKPRLVHVCSGDILICQLKSLGEQSWGRIRQRTNIHFMGQFRICQNFFRGMLCQPGVPNGYNLCHFAHSQEEMIIWDADRARNFNGKELVAFLRDQELYRRAHQLHQKALKDHQLQKQQMQQQMQQHHEEMQRQQRDQLTRESSEPSKPIPPVKASLLPEKSSKSGKKQKGAKEARKDDQRPESSSGKHPEGKGKKTAGGEFTSERGQNVAFLIQSLQGNFVYCCGACFHASPPRISIQHHRETSKCTNNERRHDWTMGNRLLVFFSYVGEFFKVRARPPSRPAKVPRCWNTMKRYGCLRGDTCGFAHSSIEVEFWLFESRFSFISRDDVVEVSERMHPPPDSTTSHAATTPKRPADRPPSPSPRPQSPSLKPQSPSLSAQSPSAPGPPAQKQIPSFQHDLRILCGVCYPKITERSVEHPSRCGSSSQHPWGTKTIYQIFTRFKKWVRVFPRHAKLRLEIHPSLCRHGRNCDFRGMMNRPCMFPHYPEEKDLWVYQASHRLPRIEEVVEVKKGGSSAHLRVQTKRDGARMPTEGRGAASQFACHYCKMVFDEKWHLEQHLKSPGHIAKMNSDQEKQWQHRDPPSQITNGIYQLCQFNASGMCKYSGKPDDENLCDNAHSVEELTEWSERHKYRMMKMEKVREQRLFSFLDELLQAYNFTNSKEEVMMKELPGVDAVCAEDLEITIPYEEPSEEGSYSKIWNFQVTVSEQKKLKRVGLLYDEHRHYFYLSHPSGEERPQICPGSRLVINAENRNRYSFQVLFTSDVLGCFHQWVVFDFGTAPVLYVPLTISIGSEQVDSHLMPAAPSMDLKETWTANNSEIVEYPSERLEDPLYRYLKEQYPPPLKENVKLAEDHQMSQRNVKDHFHSMLSLEELACKERLKKFSGRTKLEIFDAINEEGLYQRAPDGYLFGKISLTDSLLDDSEASQIVVSRVSFALLKFDESSEVVYQAKILTSKYLDFRARDSIYILLGSRCIQEQGLDPNKKNVKILVQFQLERTPFCEMHFGIDNVTEMNLIYPPANNHPRFPKVTLDECDGMNPRQASASRYILLAHKRLPFVPGPTLIIGPFGTGKSETIAKSMILLLRQSPNNKILVCTHSNSAADWLVTYYLHPFLLERQRTDPSSQRKLLRVYSTMKHPYQINPDIRDNYAIFEEGTDRTAFRKPTRKDILESHIVVTTLANSIHLVALNEGGKTIKGFFEHIFIDEAAQALETEVLIPLSLAVRETLVIMAGDHIQMRPKVYSEVARKHHFHVSMLERLFLWDQMWHSNNVLFLTHNYRMVDEILRFIAKYHYQNKLVSKSNHFRHPNYHPMSFLTVKGEDHLIGTSYINTAEANAVVEKVRELVASWPSEEWGKKFNIAVLTPYRLQVDLIRSKLRANGLGEINVESVQNVQGKEFKAVFISTVRTRKTLNKAQITAISTTGQGTYNEQYYYGFLSDEGELITAFTRCQCLLYVIGDPIALCSVGDCHATWEKYIKECENNFSLYPNGITLELIKQEIQAAKQQLSASANTFQPTPSLMSPLYPDPRQESSFSKAPAPASAWAKGPPQSVTRGSSNLGSSDGGVTSSPAVLLERLSSREFPSLYHGDQEAQEDEFGDYFDRLEIDDKILSELRIQVKKDEMVFREVTDRRKEERLSQETQEREEGNRGYRRLRGGGVGQPSGDPTIWEALDEVENENDSLIGEASSFDVDSGCFPGSMPTSEEKTSLDGDDSQEFVTTNAETDEEGTHQEGLLSNLRMIERDGSIFLIPQSRDTSNLQSARDFDTYDSDEEKDFHETELNEDQTDDWLRKTVEQPEDYKICIVRFEPTGRVYAVVADSGSSEEIVISSKRRRERALDGDKVVMYILAETEGSYEVDSTEDVAPKKIYGEVKHILERSIPPKFKKVVCTIDPINHDLMCPIDRSFPKMYPMGGNRAKHNEESFLPELQIYSIVHYGNGGFEKGQLLKVKYSDIPNMLFVVQYFEWFPRTAYPLGIITEVLPPCDSPRNASKILKLMHGVKDQWPPHLAKEIEDQFPDSWVVPKSELIAREDGDFRDKPVFTVDPPDAQDLDDGLHVERLQDGMMRVGVHIADVSYFIARGEPLDEEARKRGTTFYPAFYASASHMLPSQFSTSLCSLHPNTEKLTLSVIFTFDRDGNEVGDPQIMRSVVCPVERLTYQVVELFLLNQGDGCNISEPVKRQILDLHNLTSFLRMRRLGDGRFSYQPEGGSIDVTCTMAHTLVEEMMICANEAIAKFLVGRYGMNVPLRHQNPPEAAKTQEWLSNFERDASTSLKLTSILPRIKQVITDSEPPGGDVDAREQAEADSLPGSDDVSDFSAEDDEAPREEIVPLMLSTWEKLMGVLDNINHTHLDFQKVIGNEGGHPKQAVALSQLYMISDNGRYSCGSDLSGGCRHFDLQKDQYTHFTSPIRRYIDLVVHRMVIAALAGEEAPYTPRDLADICHHCNNQSFKAKKYGAMSRCLLTALKLKLAAEPKLCFVESANDRGLQVMYPHERFLRATRSSTNVQLRLLKPTKKPEEGAIPNSLVLYFKNSVYDLVSKVPEMRELGVFLNTDRFIQALPPSSWEEILGYLREEDSDGLEDHLYELKMEIEQGSLAIRSDPSRVREVTSEIQSLNHAGEPMAPKKYAEFRMEFKPGQVLQVQLATAVQAGLLVPKLQLISLTPKFSFCLEHRENAVNCFAELAERPPRRCRTITQYVESWLPIVDMMVVYNTVSGDETTFIRDVQIQWYKTQQPDGAIDVCGCFSLDKDWCDDRQIRFYSTTKEPKKGALRKVTKSQKKDEEDTDVELEDVLSKDFLCIRLDDHCVAPNVQFQMKNLEQKPGLVSSDTSNPHSGKMTMVVHGLTTSVSEERRGGQLDVNVEFKVHQNACNIPQVLFEQDKGTTRCTVELIPKSQPDRRMEDAVHKLQDTKTVRNLIRHICLQRSRNVMNNVEDSDNVSKYLLREGARFIPSEHPVRVNFHPPNESQATAIRMALSNTFSVIQGPPGTGKTRTGAFLAYYFHLVNRGLQESQKGRAPQILYCGPSNKSVDVIASYLKEFMSDEFSIVRVYSETIEQQEFPIPGVGGSARKLGQNQQEARMEPSLRNISLHHRIRAHDAPYSDKIREFEHRFPVGQVRVTKKFRNELKKYRLLLKAAVKSELQRHQVILCTCNAAGRKTLKDAVNIVQLIIDEAGMCSEPETLIPMVNHNASQVVLIGDHMQLRPIIMEQHAMELGAGKSLMEKYKERAHTLNIQYRMHEEICRFPSNVFYDGDLQTADAVKNRHRDELTEHIWPGGPGFPRVFCHVVGREEVLSVRSEEGNEMSKSNPQEVTHVVRIVRYFLQRLGVEARRIVVLSQYRLQCAQITKALESANLTNVIVTTVIKSQGSEWDYVILSTVRSMPKIEIEDKAGKGWKRRHLGFTMDENQMNVAMSRARRGHVVVGNKFLLGTMQKWRDLLQVYGDTDSVIPAREFPGNRVPARR